MDDMLLHGLLDIYYAEQQITKALPKMIDQATNRELAEGLKTHLEETNKQVQRLDQVFKKFGRKPSGTDCPAIQAVEDYRDCPLRHADRVGGGTWPRRHRSLPDNEPERRKSCKLQAQYRRAPQGR